MHSDEYKQEKSFGSVDLSPLNFEKVFKVEALWLNASLFF